MLQQFIHTIQSPVGNLVLISNGFQLTRVLWPDEIPPKAPSHSLLHDVARQFDEYFRGRRRYFDVPIMFDGTPFQQKVWHALQAIPYGATQSYQQLASSIGHPNAYRAVGNANGRNPLPIVVPCHRVIESSGGLGGFGGGLATKSFLLELESSSKDA